MQKVIINDKHSFELYGFDFLIDEALSSWLLEINASPSLSGTTGVDGDLKSQLIDDTFTIVDMEKVLSGNEVQVGGYDLIYKGGPIIMASNSTLQTLLGCHNNRINQSKQLAKSTSMRLAQQYAEKLANELNGQPEKPKYSKNFSSLPTKTGAMYKEAYKEKLRKEKEEREKEDKPVKESTGYKTYNRGGISNMPTKQNTLSTAASSNNGQTPNPTKPEPHKKPFGGGAGSLNPKTPDATKKDDSKDIGLRRGDTKTGDKVGVNKPGMSANKYGQVPRVGNNGKTGSGTTSKINTGLVNGKMAKGKVNTMNSGNKDNSGDQEASDDDE